MKPAEEFVISLSATLTSFEDSVSETGLTQGKGMNGKRLRWRCAVDLSTSCWFDDVLWTLESSTLVTCVGVYLGGDSAQGYLCPLVTVSVSFRFHSLCNAHLPFNCLGRNIKWSSCVAASAGIFTSLCLRAAFERSQRKSKVQTGLRPG